MALDDASSKGDIKAFAMFVARELARDPVEAHIRKKRTKRVLGPLKG